MNDDSISRVTRSRAAAQASYDRLSRWYDLLAASEHQHMAAGLDLLRPQPGEKALEIGAGTGRGLLALARAVGDSGHVWGVDLSAGMMAVARRRLQAAGIAARVTLETGDAAHLPFAAAAFDLVFMSFTLELFDTPEIPQVLAECARVLRPGGRLGVVALDLPARPGRLARAALRSYEWAHRRLPTLVDCRPIPVPALLEDTGYHIDQWQRRTMWGLPVALVVAYAPPSAKNLRNG